MNQPDPIRVIHDVTRILTAIGIRFFVSGSIASSLYGEPRSTNDIDIVADISEGDAEAIVNAFAADYYIDEHDVRNAIHRASSFNIVHNETVQKVDIFVAGQDPHTQEELERVQSVSLEDGQSIPLASREDLILQKLLWFDRGNRVSDRQWRDVLGLLKGADPDVPYMNGWARQFGISELLTRALSESGLDAGSG
jgi:hypothetical protein